MWSMCNAQKPCKNTWFYDGAQKPYKKAWFYDAHKPYKNTCFLHMMLRIPTQWQFGQRIKCIFILGRISTYKNADATIRYEIP